MRAHTFVSCGCGGGYVDGVACVDDVGRGMEWHITQPVSALMWRSGVCWFVHTVLISFVAFSSILFARGFVLVMR